VRGPRGPRYAMTQTVQLSIADPVFAAAVREALGHTCAWHVESMERPDPSRHCVMVLDETGLAGLPLPLFNPERIVLVSRKNAEMLAEAWEAGIVSVVSDRDPISTVLLAIMAAGLRVDKPSAISPSTGGEIAPISARNRAFRPKSLKNA